MTIAIHDRAGVKVVSLSGELGCDADPMVAPAVSELLADRGSRIVIDLSGVTYMNSQGLSELVQIVAQANIQEGRVILANPQPFVAGVFQATQLNRFFNLADSVDAALALLR